jgi:SNF2 family DNA or RNA helicase
MGPRIIQRSAKDAGVDIPPQDPILHEIEFDPTKYPEQAEVIKQINEKSSIVIEELADGEINSIDIPSILAEITRMRQAVTWPAGISIPCGRCYDCMQPNRKGLYTGAKCQVRKRVNVYESQKLDAVEKLIRTLQDSGERILVFSQFNEPLFELQRRIGHRSVAFTGKTPEHIKDAIKKDFLYEPNKVDHRWDILLVNSKTGGSGLDLAGADIEVIIDEEWNPGKTEQRDNRVINMLKKKTTQIHTFRQLESIDIWMAEIIAKKQETINEFESSREIIDYLVKKFLKGGK